MTGFADLGQFGMADLAAASVYRRAFIERTKARRVAWGGSQEAMAGLLGIEQGLYKQYETRTPLPHRFIPKFCQITQTEVDWLLGGGPSKKSTRRRSAHIREVG